MGGLIFVVPFIGIFAEGFWELEPDDLVVVLPPGDDDESGAELAPVGEARRQSTMSMEAEMLQLLKDCLKRSEAEPLIDCSEYEDALESLIDR